MADHVLVITGPTASGKTALAVELALRIGGEVISMDSRQIYRGMNIGTAKPSPGERRGVPHHGLDLVDPDERFNAGRWATSARTWIEDIRARGHVPIIAGGTGFFLRALTHPMFAEPPLDEDRKEAWKQYLRTLPDDVVARWAAALQPGEPVPADRQRQARIIEVAVMSGRSLAWWHAHAPPPEPPLQPRTWVLDVPADTLRARIDRRVDDMIEAGLVGEVRALLAHGYDERDPGMNATGYIELIPHVRGERSLDEAAELVRSATRRYARRQRTWMRHQLPPATTWLDGTRATDELAAQIAVQLQEDG